MDISKKLNNFVEFKYQYSWILIPTFIILYLFLPTYRIYLQYPMFCIGLIGIIVSIYIQLPLIMIIINIIGHLPSFIGLLHGLKYFNINLITFLSYLIGLFLIYYIPFWPYIPNRHFFAILFTIISLIYLYISTCIKKHIYNV